MEQGMPLLKMNVADVYRSVRWLLSRTTSTLTPRRWASTSPLAIGAEVKELCLSKHRGVGLAEGLDHSFGAAPTRREVNVPSGGRCAGIRAPSGRRTEHQQQNGDIDSHSGRLYGVRWFLPDPTWIRDPITWLSLRRNRGLSATVPVKKNP